LYEPQARVCVSIPVTVCAKFVVAMAATLGQVGDEGFVNGQAQMHIAHSN